MDHVQSTERHLYVSFSQLSTYLRCPEQFRLKYVLGHTPSYRSAEEVLGSAVHAALALLHEHYRVEGMRPPVDRIIQEFDDLVATALSGPIAILWADEGSPERLRDVGHELLKKYYDQVRLTRIIAVERRFVIPAADLPSSFNVTEDLIGTIDLIEQDSAGQTWLTELKTTARRFDDQRLAYDLQPSLYATARRALGVPDARLRFRLLVKTKKPAIVDCEVHRGEAHLREAGRVATQVLRAIDANIFFPQRGWACSTCAFRSHCGEP